MQDKKAAAKLLFDNSFAQKEIARMLRISETTISKWVQNENWRKQRLAHDLNRKTSEENALAALSHQTKIIRLISEKLGEGLDNDLSVEDLKTLLIPKGEIDAVQKLFTTVKGKELDWSGIVQILRDFMAFMKEEDITLSQELVPHVDKYINEKRKTL